MSTAPSSATIARAAAEHPGLVLDVSVASHPITLETIFVPREHRRSGVGSRAMRALCQHADEIGSQIVLKPDDCFGVPRAVLVAWYTRFGFTLLTDGSMSRVPR